VLILHLQHLKAIAICHTNRLELGPSKAASAGGVAISCLEVAQKKCIPSSFINIEQYKVVHSFLILDGVLQAIAIYHKNKIEFGPAKAANAGGVAVSGLEMAQNSARLSWSKEEVDDKLKGIMKSIFNSSKNVSCTCLLPSHLTSCLCFEILGNIGRTGVMVTPIYLHT